MGDDSKKGDACFTLSGMDLDRAGPRCSKTESGGDASERVIVRRRANLPGVEHWHVDESARLWKVYHETFTFCVATNSPGPQAWRYRRHSYEMQERATTMLIVPGEVHVTTKIPRSSFFVLRIDPDAAERELPEEAHEQLSSFAGGQTDRACVSQQFLSLCRAFEDADTTDFECNALLRQFLLAAFCADGRWQPAPSTGCERAVMRVRDVIRSRYSEPLSLEMLEQETNVSKFYLERSFQTKIGVPIHRYLKLVRLERAQRLLRAGIPAVTVAHNVGFFDSAHMTRIFKAEAGITPSAYARVAR